MVKMLERDGWNLVVARGSHRQFKHPAKPGRVTVSGHPGDDMPKGTLGSVKQQAGLQLPHIWRLRPGDVRESEDASGTLFHRDSRE